MKRFALIVALLCAVSLAALPNTTTTFNGAIEDLTGVPIPSGNVNFTLKPGIDTTISGNARFTPSTVNCKIVFPALTQITGNGVTTTVTVSTSESWQPTDHVLFIGTGTLFDLLTVQVGTPQINTVISGFQFTILSAYNGTVNNTGYVGGLYGTTGAGPCLVTQNSTFNPAYTSYSVAIQSGATTVSSFNTYAIGTGPIDISTIVPTPAQQPSYSFVDLFSNGQTISGLKSFTNTGNTYNGGTFSFPIINNATFNTATATNWLIITPTIQQPLFTTQPITLSATFNYSINWANPAAARSLTINDPLGNDSFVFANAAQTLTTKTLQSPIITSAIFSVRPIQMIGQNLVGSYGLVSVLGQSNITNRGNSIPATTLFTYAMPALQDLVQAIYYLETDGAGAGTSASITINWTDCRSGNPGTFTSATINLAVGGSTVAGSVFLCPQVTTPVQYLTTYTGAAGSTYTVIVRANIQ